MPEPLQKRVRLPRGPHNPETKASMIEFAAHRRTVSASSKTTTDETAKTGEKRKKYEYRKKEFKRAFTLALTRAKQLIEVGTPVIPEDSISQYEKTTDHQKRQELIDIMSKYTLAGKGNDRIWVFDVDDFAKRRGGPETGWIGKAVTEEMLIDSQFQFLHYGTSYGYRMIDGKKELVFAVRFTPYSEMLEAEVNDVRHLAKHFRNTFRFFHLIRTNGAHKKAGKKGQFGAEGWTAGYSKDFRLYVTRKGPKGESEKRAREIAEHTGEAEMKFVSGYYERAFEKLCPAGRKVNLHWMEDSQMPQYGATTWDPENEIEVSASNLTVTRKNFSNAVHRDNDASPFSFGIWFLAKDDGELVTDDETTRKAVTGGQFFLPEFKIAIDFSQCTGKVDMMWRGKDDPHATAHSTSVKGISRIGTSIQGAKRLLDKVKKTGPDRIKKLKQAKAKEAAKTDQHED